MNDVPTPAVLGGIRTTPVEPLVLDTSGMDEPASEEASGTDAATGRLPRSRRGELLVKFVDGTDAIARTRRPLLHMLNTRLALCRTTGNCSETRATSAAEALSVCAPMRLSKRSG